MHESDFLKSVETLLGFGLEGGNPHYGLVPTNKIREPA